MSHPGQRLGSAVDVVSARARAGSGGSSSSPAAAVLGRRRGIVRREVGAAEDAEGGRVGEGRERGLVVGGRGHAAAGRDATGGREE